MTKLCFKILIILFSLYSRLGLAQEIENDETIIPAESLNSGIKNRPNLNIETKNSEGNKQNLKESKQNLKPTSDLASNFLKPGWNTAKIRRGVGFSGSFLGTGNAFIYETGLNQISSWSYYFSFAKSSDNFTDANTTAISGVAPGTITTTNTINRTGSKNPMSLGLGVSYNKRIYRNSFFQSRWGFFGGVDYFTKVSYGTGTEVATESSTTPGTINKVQTAFGEVEVSRNPVFRLGPVFDAYVFLRWLPNLAVGFQGGMLYTTEQNTKTVTRTVTQNFSVVNGVNQTPTSYSSSNQSSSLENGGTGSTFAIAGQNFNLFGNFVIRYVW